MQFPIFTIHWPLMVRGLMPVRTVVVGIPAWRLAGARMPMGTGNGQMSVGTGSAMTPGLGLAIIMDHGFMTPIMVGSGCLQPSGPPPGSPGVKAMITSVGRLAVREE